MFHPPKISPKQAKQLSQVAFGLILVAFALYCARFIERTSFEIDGQRYFALFDDAMISMQYARNLANGDGLVWNAGGERVEGFSNPLWVLFMAFFHLFQLPNWQVSVALQMSGAVFLLGNLFFIKKIAEELIDGYLAPLLAVFLTAFYFHLNNWALQGMEVGALALLLSASVWLALRNLRVKRFSVWPYALLTLGTLVRFDMVVPQVILTGILAWKDLRHRRSHLIWGLGLLAASTIVQTLLRLWYYGEWLPNTYYLKVLGVSLWDRIERGLIVLGDFTWGSGWFLMVLPILLVLLWPNVPTILLFGLLIGQIAYSVFVGGDAWEHKGGANRFIAIVMPLFFILFVQTLEKIRQELVKLRRKKWASFISHAALAGLIFASLFNFNVINENNPVDKWTLIKRPIFVPGTQRYVTLGLLLNKITDKQAKIAVVTAGNIIYFADREGIDMLGKSDAVIARSLPHENGGSFDNVDEVFRPGHNKWDYEYSINQLMPDIVAQIWGSSREMAPYLDAGGYEYFNVDGFELYIRTDSVHVLWDEVNNRLQQPAE
jgi:hypothetical protein